MNNSTLTSIRIITVHLARLFTNHERRVARIEILRDMLERIKPDDDREEVEFMNALIALTDEALHGHDHTTVKTHLWIIADMLEEWQRDHAPSVPHTITLPTPSAPIAENNDIPF